tara:strand:+ start:1141 stop:1470 length:330 start_codon:yes stop_codon:yes gene_type:complete
LRYKIKNRSRRVSNAFHYLRVLIENKNKYVQIDDEAPQEANEEMQILLESYTLVKKITHHNPIEVSNTVMTVSWNDEDDPFELKMRNIQTFKNAFKLFPRLAKALGRYR